MSSRLLSVLQRSVDSLNPTRSYMLRCAGPTAWRTSGGRRVLQWGQVCVA